MALPEMTLIHGSLVRSFMVGIIAYSVEYGKDLKEIGHEISVYESVHFQAC